MVTGVAFGCNILYFLSTTSYYVVVDTLVTTYCFILQLIVLLLSFCFHRTGIPCPIATFLYFLAHRLYAYLTQSLLPALPAASTTKVVDFAPTVAAI